MDPLSEVLALLKPQSLTSGGFMVPGDMAIYFPKHQGIKCYAMLAGQCWLVVEGVPEPVLLQAGDCFLLPRGLPFRLTTDLSLEPVHYTLAWGYLSKGKDVPVVPEGARYIAGGFFGFTGSHAEMLLSSLPSIVHIRRESDKAAMRWSLERLREELRDPQPGGSLIAQQLAYMMLIQALRLHLADAASAGRGWLSALSDKHMSIAIISMHNDPGYPWTLQSLAERVGVSRSVFALRFRETVGTTPMEYLTRWRMLLAADRLKNSSDGLSAIAQSLGYESESAFGKAFRRIMGCSPRQYARPGVLRAISAKQGPEEHEIVVTG
ncbi:AraC family transcriptional regulator [Granulicella sp. WH15]|uniref:AraC family transcriptional regulator n=1 Tax=Granulicella sp. WH15 TaxID=2602070 RepID=UPI001366DCD3|nr:AraC family transcriptional regulator [Granulicella sp. WH15]QHN03436.1 AraC family transcriptional regulator [Granulicella sp. WH15]